MLDNSSPAASQPDSPASFGSRRVRCVYLLASISRVCCVHFVCMLWCADSVWILSFAPVSQCPSVRHSSVNLTQLAGSDSIVCADCGALSTSRGGGVEYMLAGGSYGLGSYAS